MSLQTAWEANPCSVLVSWLPPGLGYLPSQEEQGQDPEVIQYHLTPCAGGMEWGSGFLVLLGCVVRGCQVPCREQLCVK